jgi:Fe-S-cluster containining protein
MLSLVLSVFRGFLSRITFSQNGVPGLTAEDKAKALRYLFDELNGEIAWFRLEVGLKCPGACGYCCENSVVETTELEMIPVALELVHQGTAERFYDTAEKMDFEGRCVLYEPDLDRPGSGRCSHYELRPFICRLFGFSGNPDKNGAMRLVACGRMKEKDRATVEKAVAIVEEGHIKPPVMANYITKAASIDPELAREQVPINKALKRAIDRVWLHQKFAR